jgi:hypothetical protein
MTSRPTVAQHQLEPKSGKIITHFGNRSVFIVYVKRHNGRKIIVHMGTGDQLKEVLDFYNSYEIYRHDRKYLCHRMDDEPLEKETKVLMENGRGDTHIPTQAGRKRIDYKFSEMSAIKHVPVSITKGLDELINREYVINSQVMTKSRLIMILLAELLALPEEDRLKYLARGDLLLERHKLGCGGITPERIEKQNALAALNPGEDLL